MKDIPSHSKEGIREFKLLSSGEVGRGLLFIFLFCFNPLFSQKDTSQFYNKTLSNNNFSVELGGKSILYSIGYERTFYKSKKLLLTGSINLSYEPFAGFDGIILPTGINTLLGEKRNKLLLGLYETNGFDFNPYPKTRKEREAYRAIGNYKNDKNYSQPYRLYLIVPSIGYRRYFKKGNSISFEYNYLIDNSYGDMFFDKLTLASWFGINYNLKF